MDDNRNPIISSDEDELVKGRARVDELTGRLVPTTSWYPVPLDDLLTGELPETPPVYFSRSDGRAILYEDQSHVFWGPSGSLKSFAALAASASVVAAGRSVLYVDFEMNKRRFVQRARLLGIPDSVLQSGASPRLYYVHPDETFMGVREEEFRSVGIETNPALIVLDGLSMAFALHGKDPMSTKDSADMQRRLSFTCASLAIDHTAKGTPGKRSGSGAFGAQQKRAGVDVEVEFVEREKGGHGGRSSADLYVPKDRDGYIQEFAIDEYLGRFVVDSGAWHTGPVATFEAPAAPGSAAMAAHDKQVQVRRDRVLDHVRLNPGVSTAGIRRAIGGRAIDVDSAIAALEGENAVENRGGKLSKYHVVVEES